MDHYLLLDSAYDRLYREYKTHGRLVVAFDFDETVYDTHKRGHTYELVHQLLRDLKELGCELICWTAKANLDFVREELDRLKIPCDGINNDGIRLPWASRKPFYSAILDDRSGLRAMYYDLLRLVNTIKEEKPT